MAIDFDSIDERSITKESWEKFRSLHNRKYEYRIERLGVTVRFTPLTVGAIQAMDKEITTIGRALKAIEFSVIEPLGSDLSKLKGELTNDEALNLTKAIEEKIRLAPDDEAEVLKYKNEYGVVLSISKETHWFFEVYEMSYEDVMQLCKILKNKAKMLDYLSEKYHLEHPKKKDEKFWDEMQIMMGDPTSALQRLNKHERDRQLKDRGSDEKHD